MAILGDIAFGPAVKRMRREGNVAGLVRLLQREATRSQAARALGEMQASGAVKALIAVLRRSDLGERTTIPWALGRIGDASDAVVEALTDALADPDPDVQSAAADALHVLGDPSGLAPPLAAHEAETVERVMSVVRPLVEQGLATVQVVRPDDESPFGVPPPLVEVRPASPTACPITVQIDHSQQVSLFMGEPTWCETWHADRADYLDWIESAVQAVVDGRYEEWVKPETRQAKGLFHFPDGPHSFTDGLFRDNTTGFEHRVYTSYSAGTDSART